jgi:hypothetical protein
MLSEISIGFGFDIYIAAINPPSIIPATKNKFQISFFQSYLKNEIFAGKQLAQICLKELEIPKDLLPMINKIGTISPIKGPAIYQGRGDVNMFLI